jgi:hypothetical protein
VPIDCESRIAKLGLNASELPMLDAEFEEMIPKARDEERRLALCAFIEGPRSNART